MFTITPLHRSPWTAAGAVRPAAISLAIALLLAQAAPGPVAAQSDWRVLRRLDLVPQRHTLQFVSLLDRSPMTFVANAVPMDAQGTFGTPPALFVVDGRVAPLPTGDFVFMYPEIAAGPRGELHMIWGEPPAGRRPRTPPQWLSARPAAVWYARYLDGRWSPAELLRAGQQAFVNYGRHLAVDDSGRVHVVVALTDSLAFSPRVLHAVRDGGWRFEVVEALTEPFVAVVARSGDTAMEVAGVFLTHDHTASVRLLSLSMRGDWRSTSVLTKLPYEPQGMLLLHDHGPPRIIWSRLAGPGRLDGQELLSAAPAGQGEWRVAELLKIPGILVSVHGEEDPCGNAVILAEEITREARLTMTEFVLQGVRVQRRALFSESYAAGNSAMTRVGRDLFLLWTRVRQPELGPELVLSRRSGCL